MCFLLGLLPFLTYFGLQYVSRPESAANETELYQQLLRKALGDHAKVERLIEHERQRNPQGKRAEWLRAALDRWERDAQ